jgi:hypothetical protein
VLDNRSQATADVRRGRSFKAFSEARAAAAAAESEADEAMEVDDQGEEGETSQEGEGGESSSERGGGEEEETKVGMAEGLQPEVGGLQAAERSLQAGGLPMQVGRGKRVPKIMNEVPQCRLLARSSLPYPALGAGPPLEFGRAARLAKLGEGAAARGGGAPSDRLRACDIGRVGARPGAFRLLRLLKFAHGCWSH